MDKPISMSVKDFLIRKLAVQLMTSEKLIEQVVNHQFQSANEAMSVNNSVEISGFGKLFFNNKKAVKRVSQLNGKRIAMERIIADEQTTEQRRRAAQITLEQTLRRIETIKPKINED